jgi:PAS domain S-box-containing protein
VLLLDPDTRKITDANPFMTKLLGYGRAQLIGKELFEIGLLKDEVASQEMFRKLRLKREARYEDLPLESKTGRHQEVEVVANLYQENGHSVIQCNIRDITARKRSEEALRQSEDRYRTLFDSIDEGFCVIEMRYDRRGRPNDYAFLEVNPSFERQTGIRRATGRRIRAIAPQMEALWFERYGAVARTGVAHRFVMEAKPLGRWFDVYAFRLGGADSRKVAVLFRDVTERKRTDQALSEARAQLFQHAGQLEKQIATRTAQLTTTNRRLQNSVTATLKGKEEYRLLLEASQAMQEKLRQLTHQIIRAQEEERKEISRELHDEVVQSLVGINVELSALVIGTSGSVDAMRTKIARTQRLVEHSVTAVHRFARGLRPAVLDDLGLIPALHAYCKALAERKKLKIHLTVFNGVERLDDAGRTVLFRVAQEALNNVARHAHATRVTLAISEIPGAVRMEIADNGSAFPVEKILSAKNPNRLGLVGMKERIEMVGGQLTIVSTPGSGTTVRTEIPFTPPPLKK